MNSTGKEHVTETNHQVRNQEQLVNSQRIKLGQVVWFEDFYQPVIQIGLKLDVVDENEIMRGKGSIDNINRMYKIKINTVC